MTSNQTALAETGSEDSLSPFWASVERLLLRQSDGTAVPGLGPLLAVFLRRAALRVPRSLESQEQWAALRMAAVPPLLRRVRAGTTGELVLMKGAEVALRYPESARQFSDVDLLVPDARRTHRELREAGFVEVGDPEVFYRIHHLRPLVWPTLPLAVEIHSRPKWPERMQPPDVARIIQDARPSGLGVDDILAPVPSQHALLLAAHAWAHQPLLRVRDLIDVGAVAEAADPSEIEATARDWGMLRLWRATAAARDAVVGQGRGSLATRIWARHLADFRERTVLENHLQEWLAGYWALPPRAALAQTLAAFVDDVRPAPEEGWRDKYERALKAFRNARSPLSDHNRMLGDAASRGQRRNAPDDDDLQD